MGPLDLVNHLLNFVAPVLVVGGLAAFASRFIIENTAYPSAFWSQFAINSVVGVIVSWAGLVVFGRDGKMLTYLALLLAIATSQWWQSRGWVE